MPHFVPRRQFLGAFGALASLPLVGSQAQSAARAAGPVVVIGAGAAGLAAARALGTAGTPVIVLEARARIGGRIHTVDDLAPHPVELGAEFIHGDSVSTWEWVREAGLVTLNGFEDAGRLLVQRAGERWGEALADELTRLDEIVYNLAAAHADAKRPDVTLAALLDEAGEVTDPALRRLMDNLFQAVYAAALDQQGVYGLLEMADDPGEDHRVEAGYSALLALAAQGLDIRLNTVVERIAWSRDGVRIFTRDGEEYAARRCILTLPLGVLQAGDIVFEPPLPVEKQAAISGLGSGAVGKVILRFDVPFWPEDLEFLVTELSLQSLWRPGFLRADEAPTLTAFFGGRTGERYSALGEAGAVEAVLADLEAIFGERGLANRVRAARFADWWGDPFSRMGYSYTPVGSAGLREALAAPVDGVLFFAGEATSTGRPAFVHGAIDSGARAAQEVLTA